MSLQRPLEGHENSFNAAWANSTFHLDGSARLKLPSLTGLLIEPYLKLVAGHLPAHQGLAQLNHLVLVPRGLGLVPPIKSSVHIARDRGRNHAVLTVVYLTSTKATADVSRRSTLAGRALTELMPAEPEVHGRTR